MLRIPVCMHNVAEERIFPAQRLDGIRHRRCGGADYRACTSYGPLYGS